jgi:hypothetical protein
MWLAHDLLKFSESWLAIFLIFCRLKVHPLKFLPPVNIR